MRAETAPPLAPLRLAAWYAAFAALATAVNIGSQAAAKACYGGPYAVPLSMAAGTGCGLLVKYWLDKRYIFRVRTRNLAHDGRLFVLYTVMGLATTALFWGVEYAFQWIWHADLMRYLGGTIGLAAGYFAKYKLDRRFVFQATGAAA
ncbi:MAG: GtrA family protein [Nevskia sp.]|nr:GtrA family protein [Nevskia sp.]